MTNEELAEHWGVSLQEVYRISDIVNANFHCAIAQGKTDKLFYGVMFKWHESPSGNQTPILAYSSKKRFQSQAEAIQDWNKLLDNVSAKECEIMGLPKDAFKAIRKIPEPVRITQRQIPSVQREDHTR